MVKIDLNLSSGGGGQEGPSRFAEVSGAKMNDFDALLRELDQVGDGAVFALTSDLSASRPPGDALSLRQTADLCRLRSRKVAEVLHIQHLHPL